MAGPAEGRAVGPGDIVKHKKPGKYAHFAGDDQEPPEEEQGEDYDEDDAEGGDAEDIYHIDTEDLSDPDEADAAREAQETLADAFAAEKSNSRTQAQAKAVMRGYSSTTQVLPAGR